MGRTDLLRIIFCGLLLVGSGPLTAQAPQLAAAEVAFTEGLLAFDEGRNEEAAQRLAEAVRLNPAEGGARYFLGLTLLRLGRPGEAAEEIAASLEARHPPDVDLGRVRADLEAARRTTAAGTVEVPEWRPVRRAIDDRGLWEGSAGVSLAADSNPNLLADPITLLSPGGERIEGEQADTAALLGARLNVYPFHARESRMSTGLLLEAGQSVHQDFGFLDLGVARGAVQVAFGGDPLGFLDGPFGHVRVPFGASRFTTFLQAGGSAWQLDGSSYLRRLEGAASFSFHETAATATRLDLTYIDRDFSDTALASQGRSGEELAAALSQLVWFGRRDRFVRLGAAAGERDAGEAFSASFLEGIAELRMPLAARWVLHGEAAVRRTEYDEPASNLFDPFGDPREDTTTRGAVTLSWAATNRLRWTARAAYTDRDSDLDLGGEALLDYRRTVASVGLSWVMR